MDSRRRKIATGLLIASIGLMGMGCFERNLRPVNPCTRSNVGETIRVQSVDKVDLLFMIDNSNSMGEEQAQLTVELPRLVSVLATGDRDADGMQDFQPVASLHIGVVTSDMGTGGFAVPTCDRGTFGTMFGDDGVLITRGRTAIPGCLATYPQVFDFVRGTTDPTAYAMDVSCVATTGTGGCGFEQQLEAILKAISPSVPQDWTQDGYVPPVFFASSFGHADNMNSGFLRGDSALAIILVSDEEDCSAANPEIFNMASTEFPGDLNLRCWMYEEDTNHPIERYVEGTDMNGGLINLRENPALLIFAGIVGVPVDAAGTDYAAMLAHPDMQNMLDPDAPTTAPRLRPSCNTANGIAFPPRRIVRVAQGLQAAGASTTIQSICQSSYTAALDTIIEKIADALGGACLPRDLNPDAEGMVGCDVFEILPEGSTMACADLPGRVSPTGSSTVVVDGVERTICSVLQVGPAGFASGAQGWFYETTELMLDTDLAMLCGPGSQRIKFTINPVTNSDIRLECLQTVAPGGGAENAIGSFCVPGPDGPENLCSTGTAPSGAGFALTCDPAVRTCGVACTETADCTAAGLLGDVCDTRPYSEAVGADDPGITEDARNRLLASIPDVNMDGVVNETDYALPHNFCVNPTCI